MITPSSPRLEREVASTMNVHPTKDSHSESGPGSGLSCLDHFEDGKGKAAARHPTTAFMLKPTDMTILPGLLNSNHDEQPANRVKLESRAPARRLPRLERPSEAAPPHQEIGILAEADDTTRVGS